jgi:hypothetical protein
MSKEVKVLKVKEARSPKFYHFGKAYDQRKYEII